MTMVNKVYIMFDAIIIGAGPSGLMCAITLGSYKKKVLLIEKNEMIGKKMRLTGGGRCNITNLKDVHTFINSLPIKSGRFLYHALTNFGPKDIWDFFEKRGVPLKVEDNDRVFPKSNRALDFLEVFEQEIRNNNITLLTSTEVTDLKITDNIKTVYTTKGAYTTENVVIATGGLSYPHTGSTGFGHNIVRKFNHTVTEIYPTESPLISYDEVITSKILQGLSFKGITITLLDENEKPLKSQTGDLLITHFGLSGPASLRLSQFAYHYLKHHKEALVTIDFLPEQSIEHLKHTLVEYKQTEKTKTLKNILKNFIPERLSEYLVSQLKLTNQKMSDVSKHVLNDLSLLLKNFPIKVHGVKPLEVAFVTGGGISLSELNPKSMESKLIPGLYFVGEVCDLHGYTGGYNLTIALSTGYTCGMYIAQK